MTVDVKCHALKGDLRHCERHECWVIDECQGCADEALERAMEDMKDVKREAKRSA